jgi:hypothetical protein
MRSVLLLASTAAAIFVGSGGVFAQQLIEPYPADPPYYNEYAPSGSSAYRYRSDTPALVPARPVSCGEFRYWNGERCVDARVIPPDVR